MNKTLEVTLYVIGNLVGAGFFLMPSVLNVIGLSAIYSFCIALLITIFFIAPIIKLYSIIPNCNVLSDYFEDPDMKKITAIIYLGLTIIGNASFVITISQCIKYNQLALNTIVIILATLLNQLFKRSIISNIEGILTIVKFGILLLIPIVIFAMNLQDFALPSFGGTKESIFRMGISCFFCFLGLETAMIFGSGKNAIKGMFFGTTLTAVLYLITTLILVSSGDTLNSSVANPIINPFVAFADRFIPYGGSFLNLLIIFCVFGTLYGWIAAAGLSCTFYAETNILPNIFKKKAVSGISLYGLWMSSFLTWLILLYINTLNQLQQFLFIADLSVYIYVILYNLCALVLFLAGGTINRIISIFSIVTGVMIFYMDYYNAMLAIIFFILVVLIVKFKKIISFIK